MSAIATLPQLLASIKQNAAAAVGALHRATNEVREVLGQEPLPQVTMHGPVPAASLVSLVRITMTQTAEAFAELRQAAEAVAGVTSDTPAQPVNGIEQKPESIPTLAGGLLEPAIIDATDLAVPTTPQPEPEPTPEPEPDGDDDAAVSFTNEECDALANAQKEADDEDRHTNRVATHLNNGHVEPGEELATLGITVEDSSAGKRGGKRRRKT